MKYFVVTIFLVLFAFTSNVDAEEHANRLLQARSTVEAYCQNEFSGNDPETRERLIKFSPKLVLQHKKEELDWTNIYVDSLEQVVVSSYKIGSINTSGSHATAIVVFQRLAHKEVTNNVSYIIEQPHDETVTLNLIYDKNKWYVLDPPPPRISRDRLIEFYEGEIKWYADQLKENGELPAHQQVARDKKLKILTILKRL